MILNINFKDREKERRIKELRNSNKLLSKDINLITREVARLKDIKESKEIQSKMLEELTSLNGNLVVDAEKLKKELKDLTNEFI